MSFDKRIYRIVKQFDALNDGLVREIQLRCGLDEANAKASQFEQNILYRCRRFVVIVKLGPGDDWKIEIQLGHAPLDRPHFA